MVGHEGEVEAVVTQREVEVGSLGLRPLAGGRPGTACAEKPTFGLRQLGQLLDDAAEGFGRTEIALAAETLTGRQLTLLLPAAGFDHSNIFIFNNKYKRT